MRYVATAGLGFVVAYFWHASLTVGQLAIITGFSAVLFLARGLRRA